MSEQFNPGTSSSTPNPGVTTASETCAHCGQPLGGNKGVEQFLSKIGITSEMIDDLKTSMQNVDIEEYLNTAREYLKTAGDKVKTGSEKAKVYSKEHPGKVAAGVAILAVGAGLLINAINKDR
jgi:hypothetical protein